MADYIWTESAATALEVAPRIGSTRFGDGYEERAPAGLNPITQAWQVRHVGVDNAIAEEIMAFLEARVSAINGLEAFDWVPLWSTTAIRVTCRQWRRVQDEDPNTSSIDAVFTQEHVA